MSKTDGTIKINVWINDERLATLEKAGMAQLAQEAFAGMKVLAIHATEQQKDVLLQRYSGAKYDSATTKSIELLPKKVKDELLELAVKMHSTDPDVTSRFLAEA
ncbi:DUF6955 family protein [Mycobacterium sp.]|uniref:DUF6955 family protein n=1 Tax=Mycobacterium sp. TaxID=1785 RepID=UPI003C75E4A6